MTGRVAVGSVDGVDLLGLLLLLATWSRSCWWWVARWRSRFRLILKHLAQRVHRNISQSMRASASFRWFTKTCRRHDPRWVNESEQSSHEKGFSPVWVRVCLKTRSGGGGGVNRRIASTDQNSTIM